MPFYADSYRQAASSAASQSKLLFIYLHSPLHQDAEDFCRGLTSAQFQGFCRQRFVLWGASVNSADGHALEIVGRDAVPVSGDCHMRRGGEKVVASHHGAPSDGDALVATLDGALDSTKGRACRRCAGSSARGQEARRRLRTEQDRDYQEGLERDRLREAQRQAEREEAERRARAEREAREQAELEAAQAESLAEGSVRHGAASRFWHSARARPVPGRRARRPALLADGSPWRCCATLSTATARTRAYLR